MSKAIQTKQCSKCKHFKAFSEFYKNRTQEDGHSNQCKTCIKEYKQSEKGILVKLKSDKKYSKTDKGKIALRKARKKYTKTDKNKAAQKRYLVRNPHYRKATGAISSAIRASKLPRANTMLCHYFLQNPDCKTQAEQYHHHWGYAPEHWLDVIPVCVPCHKKFHQ